jgi:hypothetical protein
MAVLLQVEYPDGERVIATGYPVADTTLVVREVPRGPQAAYGDVLEVDMSTGEPYPVVKIVGGPRRATIRVHVPGSAAHRERWMEAREAEGWLTADADAPDGEIWVAPSRDDLDSPALARTGATILPG